MQLSDFGSGNFQLGRQNQNLKERTQEIFGLDIMSKTNYFYNVQITQSLHDFFMINVHSVNLLLFCTTFVLISLYLF